MAKSFEATIAAWVKQSQAGMTAVAQEAAQELSEEVTMKRAKGGNMPVDTGFLVNSYAAALNSVPSGEASGGSGYKRTDFDMAPITIVLNKLKAGDRLVMGFTANYAQQMEARYFFVRLAAQNWQQYVSKAARKIERGIRA